MPRSAALSSPHKPDKEDSMKRLVLLAMVLLIIGSIDATAACFNCKPITQTCAAGFRFTFCDDSTGMCIVDGTCTAAAPAATVALASQWTVASVERLDEPRPAAAPAKLAQLRPNTTHRR
jgi:hypothetical protein